MCLKKGVKKEELPKLSPPFPVIRDALQYCFSDIKPLLKDLKWFLAADSSGGHFWGWPSRPLVGPPPCNQAEAWQGRALGLAVGRSQANPGPVPCWPDDLRQVRSLSVPGSPGWKIATRTALLPRDLRAVNEIRWTPWQGARQSKCSRVDGFY